MTPPVAAPAAPPAPRAPVRQCLLVDARATEVAVDPGHVLLGLPLLRRLALAARRGGCGRIAVIADSRDRDRLATLLAGIEDAIVGSDAPERWPHDAATICVAGRLLGERGWLEAVMTLPVAPHAVRRVSAEIAIGGPGVTPGEALAALADAAVEADPASGHVDALPIAGPADLPAAEARLIRSLLPATDGFMTRTVERPLSTRLTRRLARTAITPNQMTLASAAIGLAAAPFFLSATPLWQTVGALLFVAHAILDGCDGELARLKFQESRWGGVLDFWGDNVVHAAIFAAMALGWSRAAGESWPLALGAAAVAGTLGSAGFVYWRVMRPKRGAGPLYSSVSRAPSGRFVALLDALSRRDFIYLVLALSVFGKATWFLALAAVGAPLFLLMLLVVVLLDRARTAGAAPVRGA